MSKIDILYTYILYTVKIMYSIWARAYRKNLPGRNTFKETTIRITVRTYIYLGDTIIAMDEDALQKKLRPTVENQLTKDTVEYILRKGATYPSETAYATGHSEKDTARVMRKLRQVGILESVAPRFKNNDPRLLNRKSEMWQRGVTGKQAVQGNRTWYVISDSVKIDDQEKQLVVIEPDALNDDTNITHVIKTPGGEVIDYVWKGEDPRDRLETDLVTLASAATEK